MQDLDVAADLYLRGFKGDRIKAVSGISIQSFLKTMRGQGVVYTKQDVRGYQERYIRERYSPDEVETAYCEMSARFPLLEDAAHRKEIEVLGCCFGQYAPVFASILGSSRYKDLKARVWADKQARVIEDRYGVSNVFDKRTFNQFVSDEAVVEGRAKRRDTLLARYGVEHPNQDPEIQKRMMTSLAHTFQERFGVSNPMQVPEIALRSAERRQQIMFEKYGYRNTLEMPGGVERLWTSRKQSGRMNTSISEDTLHDLLVDQFGTSDVTRNVVVDDRYPFHVDFYIASRDMFIELNGDSSHGGHWFDETDDVDVERVRDWVRKAQDLGGQKRSSRYDKYIETWTIRDVLKRSMARDAALNYAVFWDGRTRQVNGVREGRLRDAREWFEAGCRDRQDWQ